MLQVQQLLLRHAPALAAWPEKQAFLRERLGVPPDWLAGALMVWARYSRDAAGIDTNKQSCEQDLRVSTSIIGGVIPLGLYIRQCMHGYASIMS